MEPIQIAVKPDIWMPLYIGDYMADTIGLSLAEHGAYLLSIMAYWRKRGPLTDVEAQAVMLEHCSSIARFFQVEGGMWRHKRIDIELKNAELSQTVANQRAKKAAAARWNAQAMHKQCLSNAQAMLADAPSPSPIMDINVPRANKGNEMSLEQCLKLAELEGIAADCAKSWWLSVDARGWLDNNGQLIVNPESSLRKWAVTWRLNESKTKQKESQPQAASRKSSVLDLKTIMAAKKDEATELKNVHSAEVATGRMWNSISAKAKWQKLMEEIKNLNQQIATYPNR